MVWDAGSLQTRQFARRNLMLAARLEVHADHAEQIRLSFPEEGGRPTIVDVSEGGMGLCSSIYLPRMARLTVHIPATPELEEIGGDGVSLRTIVRRCGMTDVKPTYHIGLQFADPGLPEIVELVKGAKRLMQAGGNAPASGPSTTAPAPRSNA